MKGIIIGITAIGLLSAFFLYCCIRAGAAGGQVAGRTGMEGQRRCGKGKRIIRDFHRISRGTAGIVRMAGVPRVSGTAC